VRYAATRLVQAVPLLLLVSVAAFAVMHLAPGGPTTAYLRNPLSSDAQVGAMRRAMGLADPLPIQYLHWLTSLLQGNWGYSYADGRPVLEVIVERLPATLLLMITALGFALALAIPVGIVGAVRKSSWLDHMLTVSSLVTWAMPVFWLGLVAQELLAVDVPLFPVAGLHASGASDPLDLLHHLVLPALVLGLASLAGWSRYLRASLSESLNQPYVTTARAKGASPTRALLYHALPNALIPLVTVIGLDIPRLFAGAVVTETVFAWPGMGRLFFDSLGSRDYPVELGLLMITATLIVLGNLVADLLCAALDPRVRLGAVIR
jgi:peptide/nickel transport system permease protein